MRKRYIIGVTGHRKLPADKIPIITQEIKDFFGEIKKSHGDSEITVLSSLAEGADMLCAELALDMGLRLAVPLPMNASEYRKDFSNGTAEVFDCLLSMADEVFTVIPEESIPDHPAKGFYYRQAGIYVAKHCDILLAVWDGMERDTQDSAGTWETVKTARKFNKTIHMTTI